MHCNWGENAFQQNLEQKKKQAHVDQEVLHQHLRFQALYILIFYSCLPRFYCLFQNDCLIFIFLCLISHLVAL